MGDVCWRLGNLINSAVQPKFRLPSRRFPFDSSFVICSSRPLLQVTAMNLDHIKAEIARMRVQIKRQQRDILDLQRAGFGTASAIALLERMHDKVDALVGQRNRLTGEARVAEQHTNPSGKAIRGVPSYRRMSRLKPDDDHRGYE